MTAHVVLAIGLPIRLSIENRTKPLQNYSVDSRFARKKSATRFMARCL
jgi:hypothetical protein